MPEEIESPVEHLSEEIHEAAHHAKENWLKWSALLSALFAVLAAIAGLQSAHYANDAMIEQIEASDQWGYYQAKGIKALVMESERDILAQLGKPADAANGQKLDKYRRDQEQSKEEAEKRIEASKAHIERHEVLSRAVTLFQVAIAVIAISVLTKRRYFVLVACTLGMLGAFFLLYGQVMH